MATQSVAMTNGDGETEARPRRSKFDYETLSLANNESVLSV